MGKVLVWDKNEGDIALQDSNTIDNGGIGAYLMDSKELKGLKFCYDDCKHLNMTEKYQEENKCHYFKHWCKKYMFVLKHHNDTSKLVRAKACHYLQKAEYKIDRWKKTKESDIV